MVGRWGLKSTMPEDQAAQSDEKYVKVIAEKGLDLEQLRLPPSPELRAVCPGLSALSARQWMTLQAWVPREELLYRDKPPRVVDVSQMPARAAPAREGTCGCWTPKGAPVHTGKGRLLLAVEGLRLQNIFYDDPTSFISKVPDRLLRDLSGNAFQTNCCGAVVLAAFVSIALAASGAGRSSAAGEATQLASGSADGAAQPAPPEREAAPEPEDPARLRLLQALHGGSSASSTSSSSKGSGQAQPQLEAPGDVARAGDSDIDMDAATL